MSPLQVTVLSGAQLRRKLEKIAKRLEAPAEAPRFALDIQEQLGRGINGAIAYTGSREFRYGPYDIEMPQVEPDEHGLFEFTNCVRFRPNTKQMTLFVIAIQPGDTYTVWLWRKVADPDRPGLVGEILKRYDDVHAEDLQRFVEETYDEYIKEHQGGWIEI